MTPDPISQRLVVHVGGYDPMTPEAAHGRFVRELARFARTWRLEAEAGGPAIGADVAAWPVATGGPNWRVRTTVRLLRWDDLMDRAAREPRHRRVARGLLAGADFVYGGALFGYGRHAWRYALFFLFPFVLLAACLGASAGIAAGIGDATGSGLAAAAAGIAAASGLLAWSFRRAPLDHLLDDWIFARDLVRNPDPPLSARLDREAAAIVEASRSGRYDEIVVIGHSLGAVLAVDLVDRAQRLDPRLGRGSAAAALVTVGSSIPKIGLHRGAVRLREALRRVAGSGLFWVEYQTLIDAMNFYKVDPVPACGAGPKGPLLRIIRLSRMLERSYYLRIKYNFFRVHNQFVSANDKRAVYDYFMLLCGPVPVADQARATEGCETGIAADGTLLREAAGEGERAVPARRGSAA